MPTRGTIPPKNINKNTSTTSVNVDEQRGLVHIEKGITKNIGDFNSARITIGMTLPLNYTNQDLKEARKALVVVSDIIDAEMEHQIEELSDVIDNI